MRSEKPRASPFGQFLTDCRKGVAECRKGPSLTLASLAKSAGLSIGYLSQLEQGLKKPSDKALRSLSGALDIQPNLLREKLGYLGLEDVLRSQPKKLEPWTIEVTDAERAELQRYLCFLRLSPTLPPRQTPRFTSR